MDNDRGSEAKARARKRREPSLREHFMHGVNQADAFMVAGFACCQAWILLCFFSPQLFPENAATMVSNLSLAVSVIGLIPGLVLGKKFEAFLENRATIGAMAACATAGTLLVPLSAGAGAVSLALQVCAALLIGFPSGCFFAAWYQAFCKTNMLASFIVGTTASSVFLYVLTSTTFLPEANSWVLQGIACLLPLVSALCLLRSPRNDKFVSETHLPPRGSAPRRSIMCLCGSLFVISSIDEFMRNYYLESTDLAFFSSALNLVLIVVKVVCCVFLISLLFDGGRRFVAMYRISLLLAMIACLFMPYAVHSPYALYGITNFGAFLFRTMVLLIAFNFCQRFRALPSLVFSLLRMTFSLSLLAGANMFRGFRLFEGSSPDLLGIVSVVLGLCIIATYLFIFTSQGDADVFGKTDEYAREDVRKACERLVHAGGLSKREADVLLLIAKGRSAPRIQEELHVSMNTVNTHTSHVYQKLDVHSRQELLDLIEKTAPEEG